jgi:hypothetical protein
MRDMMMSRIPLTNVIHAPPRVMAGTGDDLRFQPYAQIAYADPAHAPIVERFCRDIRRRTSLRVGPALAARDAPAADVWVELARDAELDAFPAPCGVPPAGDLTPDERYTLTISGDYVIVRSAKAAGVAHGLTTLAQLLATTAPDADGAVIGRRNASPTPHGLRGTASHSISSARSSLSTRCK